MDHITKTILIVDDESQHRESMRSLLRSRGYGVLEAADYDMAEEIYRRQRGGIDLLVVDVSLPGGNGCELARAFVAKNPSLKVLFISGHVGSEILHFYGVSADDDCFLEKPFGNEELLARIRRLLDPGEAFSSGAAG